MSDTILSGRWVVYYLSENRQKRLYRDVATTPTVMDDINDVYSALVDLQDEQPGMQYGTVMKAVTPTEYKIGIIDAGDSDPWFIDRTSAEYLTSGSLETVNWDRVEGTNTGIIKVTCNNTNIVVGDIGEDITGDTDSDAGTLLDVQGTGAGSILWIRPDSSAAANSFDNDAQGLTCNTHTATQSAAPADGESLWPNVYSLGTIETNTHLYIYQDGTNLTAYSASTDWWSDGHIDTLVCVKECGSLIDGGYITVLARQYSKSGAYYIVDLSAGGRNPIPLQTGDDLDNTTGYRQMVLTTASDDFTVGEVIEDDSDDTIQGVVTSNTGTAPNITLQYYLIGDPLTDFSVATGGFTGADSTTTATAVDPTDVGPAALTGLSIAHANDSSTYDIDEDGTAEKYSVVIDASAEALTDVYEWCKYITRRGDTGTTNTDGLEAESYLGSDYRIAYTTLVLTVSEGDVVTQDTSLATGTVVAHHTTAKILILRNSRGTFNNTNDVKVDSSNYVTGPTCTAITPISAAPFGTFAGGKFFCAPGAVLANVPTADENNYQLTDDEGNVVVAPTKVTLTVGNTRAGDAVSVFRLTGAGGDIEKDTYTIDATQAAQGASEVKVSTALDTDEPGKAAGGVLRVVDVSGEVEDRYRFTSWVSGTPSTFTLFACNETGDADGDQTHIEDDSADFVASGVKIGDIAFNDTDDTYAYVTAVATVQLTTTNTGSDAPVTTWASKAYKIGGTVRDYTTSDKVYIALLDTYEDTGTSGSPGSETASVTYDANIPVRVRARQAGDIVPFEADATVESTGMSINVVRTSDDIYS